MLDPEALVAAMAAVRRDCDEMLAAVLSTPDGLVLAASGLLAGDVPAAAAAQLVDHVDSHLSMIVPAACSDALLWTPAALWGLARLPGRQVVLVQARPQCAPGTMRLALARLRRDLTGVLAGLDGGLGCSSGRE